MFAQILYVGLLGLLQTAVQNVDGIPAQLHAKTPSYVQPLWVSARRALAPDGSIRKDVLSAGKPLQINERFVVRRPVGSVAPQDKSVVRLCEGISDSVGDERMNPKPNRRVADLRAHAHGIYLGQIDGIDSGFLLGIPGSLLAVRIDEVLKQSAAVNASNGHVLVFYPYARIPLKDGVACRTDIAFPFRPELGSRLVVFAYEDPIDQSSQLIVPGDTEVIFESADGTLAIPALLQRDPLSNRLRSLKALRDFLAAPASHGGGEVRR